MNDESRSFLVRARVTLMISEILRSGSISEIRSGFLVSKRKSNRAIEEKNSFSLGEDERARNSGLLLQRSSSSGLCRTVCIQDAEAIQTDKTRRIRSRPRMRSWCLAAGSLSEFGAYEKWWRGCGC